MQWLSVAQEEIFSSFISEVLLREEMIIELKLTVSNGIERLFQGSIRVLVWKERRNVGNSRNSSS
jgi:hypothetical protein